MDFPGLEFFIVHFKRIVLSDNVLMTVLIVPVLFFAERKFHAIKVSNRHYRFGILYFLANAVVLGVLAPAINYSTAQGVQSAGYGLIDLGALGFSGIWGSISALLVSTFILDFFYYWFHRALHKYEVLWQTHLLHHCDENMNMMTAQRGHIFEGLLAPFFITIPMAFLFKMPALDIAILSLLPQAYHFLSHSNTRLSYGPLWWVIISPHYHRIHHSAEPQHLGKNFTNWFPVWDILFGTLYRPAKNEWPVTGVEGVKVKTLTQAFALPLVGWQAMAKRSVRHLSRMARKRKLS